MSQNPTDGVGISSPYGTLAVLGAGTMGEAITSATLAAGRPRQHVTVTARSPERLAALADRHKIRAITSNPEAVRDADLVLVSVKPAQCAGVLKEIAPHLQPSAVVVSVVVGWTTDAVASHLPAGTAVVRVMPNIGALVGASMSVLSAGSACSQEQLAQVTELMSDAGEVLVCSESLHDAAAIVCGGTPALLFSFIDAVIEGAVSLGLSRATATHLAVQTFVGSSSLIAQTGEHPVVLRERVSSPGGAAIHGLMEFDRLGVRPAVVASVRSCYARAGELGGRPVVTIRNDSGSTPR
ncbi:pyrroline-5-carboxylate reductase [Streptomyces sp. NPDC006208]|uniref:pyrroline-5-carboxylate reductase n=1 Tax=Streptomyces sp. NPDC006208 TaxID=3156734 RepID=UPI0033A2F8D8